LKGQKWLLNDEPKKKQNKKRENKNMSDKKQNKVSKSDKTRLSDMIPKKDAPGGKFRPQAAPPGSGLKPPVAANRPPVSANHHVTL
jgi:hypothetical protein